MGFTTSIFLFAFFPMCLLAYILCDRLSLLKKAGAFLNKIRAKDILLILFSLAFYMWACFDDVFRLCLYILLIYLAARWIEASRKKRLYINIYKEGQNDGSQTNKKLDLWGTLRTESVPRIYIWLLFGLWCHNPMLAIIMDIIFLFAGCFSRGEEIKKFIHRIRRIFRFCLEVTLGGAFINADTLPLSSRRSGTRLAARKRSVRQVPASLNGLLITNAPSRATFQLKAKKVQISCENSFTSCIFLHPMKSNLRCFQNIKIC